MTPTTYYLLSLLTCAIISSGNAVQGTCSVHSVCFALDQSGSITGIRRPGKYANVSELAISASEEIGSRTVGTIYSAMGFDAQSRVIQMPTTDLVDDFILSVRNRFPPGGGTDISQGLQACFDHVKTQPGNRVIVLVTDGNGGDPSSLNPVIEAAGVKVITIGIGYRINATVLSALASKPQFFIDHSNTTDLASKAIPLADKICAVVEDPYDACEDAYNACGFMFKNQPTVPTYQIGQQPDSVFSDRVSSRSLPEVGVLNSNGIVAQFIDQNGVAEPITSFGSQSLTPTHFKPNSMSSSPLSSGITHQTFQSDQLQVSRNRCVRVYFTQYQTIVLSPYPQVLDNVNAAISDNKCVVFKTV